MVITREKIVQDAAKRKLEKYINKDRHVQLLERMTSGHIFEKWTEMTVKEMANLSINGMGKRALAVYLDESIRLYAQSWLDAMISLCPENE